MYISCILKAKFFVNGAIKSATLLAHAVLAAVNNNSRDVNKTFFTRPRPFVSRPRPRPRLQKYSKTNTKTMSFWSRPRSSHLHTVSDKLAKDRYRQCTWLNKVPVM